MLHDYPNVVLNSCYYGQEALIKEIISCFIAHIKIMPARTQKCRKCQWAGNSVTYKAAIMWHSLSAIREKSGREWQR